MHCKGARLYIIFIFAIFVTLLIPCSPTLWLCLKNETSFTIYSIRRMILYL